MQEGVRPFVVASNEGETIRGPVGGPTTFKAKADTTNGSFTALENVIAPNQGPPLHVHAREDEMYYVLDGEVRFKAADQYFDATAGSFMFIPRGTAHCFQNVGKRPARMLVMFTPAGMERFFEGIAALPPGEVDPETYRRVAETAGMEVVGPPMSAG
ncbi:MAG TPA: cupin domain-containing protein [Actinomycetota bacterium]|jgi:mannose-6-phosphate isomerase-like protein (cupin superfamily)